MDVPYFIVVFWERIVNDILSLKEFVNMGYVAYPHVSYSKEFGERV